MTNICKAEGLKPAELAAEKIKMTTEIEVITLFNNILIKLASSYCSYSSSFG
jgi:hypothetical protein